MEINWADLAAMSAVVASVLAGLVYIIKKETAPLADRVEKIEDTNLEMLTIIKALALTLSQKGAKNGRAKATRR